VLETVAVAAWFEDFGLWLNGILAWVLDAVQAVDPVLRPILAGIAILLETSVLIGLIVPGDTIVVVASTAVSDPVAYFATVVAVILGALAGESIGFALGRFFGPRIRASRLGRRIGEKNWVKAERYVARRGGIAVFLSRFLPVLHSLVPLTVGMSAMRYRRFFAWTLPACVLWTFAYVTVGWLAADSVRDLLDRLHYAGYIFVGIIIVFALAVFTVKKLLERAERRHMDDAAGRPPE
jgi:membrane-associated protein